MDEREGETVGRIEEINRDSKDKNSSPFIKTKRIQLAKLGHVSESSIRAATAYSPPPSVPPAA